METTGSPPGAMHGATGAESAGRPGWCTRRIMLARLAATASALILAACTDRAQPLRATDPRPQPTAPPLPTATPSLPAECAFGLWPPTMNLNPNGGFEASDGGYTIEGGTLTISTDIARFGMRSGKVVAHASAVVVTAAIAASAFPRTTYTSSIWFYATAGVVGKTCFMTIRGAGGVAPAAELGQRAITVVAGWQRLFVTGIITQSDRTGVTLSVTLPDAAANDTFYLDGWQFEANPTPTPYLEMNGAIASRGVTSLTASAATLDAVQGWVAARLRTGYSESNVPGTPQLLRWYDNARKLLDLRYDKRVWKLRRITAAGVEEACFPSLRPSGSVLTIVAAWTINGPMISVDGASFRAPVFRDEFKRADTVMGLGTVPGGDGWQVAGEGARHARISDGRLICDPGYTMSATYPLSTNPSRLSGSFSLAGAPNGNAGLLASQPPSQVTAVFCYINRNASILRLAGGGDSTTLKTIRYRPLAVDGTVYTVGMNFNPDNSLDFESPDGQAIHVGPDARIGAYLGTFVSWMLGSEDNNWRWESVSVERVTDAPTTRIDGMPRIAATAYDIGSSHGVGDFLYGDLFWFASGTGAVTSADAATLAGYANSAPTLAQLGMLNGGSAQPTMVRSPQRGDNMDTCG